MIWFIIAAFLGCVRIAGVKHIAFQAAAHLYVGGLLGAYVVSRDSPFQDMKASGRRFLWIAVALSVLETICFFAKV